MLTQAEVIKDYLNVMCEATLPSIVHKAKVYVEHEGTHAIVISIDATIDTELYNVTQYITRKTMLPMSEMELSAGIPIALFYHPSWPVREARLLEIHRQAGRNSVVDLHLEGQQALQSIWLSMLSQIMRKAEMVATQRYYEVPR